MSTIQTNVATPASMPIGEVDARAGEALPATVAVPQLSAGDLADLLGALNDASRRLQESHEALRSEVSRLKGELREANEQLERSRRLAALGEMAAGISHEVRNPLGSIRLYARMLVDDLGDRPGERAIAEKIGLAVRGLDAIVGDVLAFARELKLRPARHEAEELLRRAVEEVLAGERSEGRGADTIELRWQAASDAEQGARAAGEAAQLWCDAGLAHRAVVNIVRNAFDAVREHAAGTPDRAGGAPHAIVLTTGERVMPEADGTRRRWGLLGVRDTGGGIPAEAMRRIFNPFFTTRAAGTGLGLAIVHRIMDAHGGRVLVRNVPAEASTRGRYGRSVLGAGAVVELLFPVASALAESAEHVTGDLAGGGEGKLDRREGAGACSRSTPLGAGDEPSDRASSVCMEAS